MVGTMGTKLKSLSFDDEASLEVRVAAPSLVRRDEPGVEVYRRDLLPSVFALGCGCGLAAAVWSCIVTSTDELDLLLLPDVLSDGVCGAGPLPTQGISVDEAVIAPGATFGFL